MIQHSFSLCKCSNARALKLRHAVIDYIEHEKMKKRAEKGERRMVPGGMVWVSLHQLVRSVEKLSFGAWQHETVRIRLFSIYIYLYMAKKLFRDCPQMQVAG